MRLIVFFDLPMETAEQQKGYRLFRKNLIKEGYIMMQKSVYSKMVLDGQSAKSAISRLRKIKPKAGLVQVVQITEKQYCSIVDIVGKSSDNPSVDTAERLVIL